MSKLFSQKLKCDFCKKKFNSNELTFVSDIDFKTGDLLKIKHCNKKKCINKAYLKLGYEKY
jgi:hypothetical protein